MVPFWFIVIAILWTGFFILEGFDFGVGMLHSLVGRDEAGRRAAINTIGPLWDGNEVWLIVAGAAMFAAFPGWYATMFSGLYLAMVLLLISLIIRGVAFEYRGSATRRAGAALGHAADRGACWPAAARRSALGDLRTDCHGTARTTRIFLISAALCGVCGVTRSDLSAAWRYVPVPQNHLRHARTFPADRPRGGPVHRGRGRGLRHLDPRDVHHHLLSAAA
jgi:cytochrome bd-type quinol oxidase subunit 2